MAQGREDSRLRQGTYGTLFVVGLGLLICLAGLTIAASFVWLMG